MKPIVFDNVSKVYRLRGRKPTFQEIMANVACALRANGKLRRTQILALRNISFQVEQGEVLGIIGPNGAGKTTILSLIAGVTRPSSGRVINNGRVAPLIALGAGFHPELTGRENIYLNGIILGMSKCEIRRKFDAIVDFAELEGFLDTPVKRYSSGMYARLGFATAIHIDPHILLVDEVLAVGDFAFQQKCLKQMEEFRESGVTIIFVSHNLDMVTRLCPKTLLLYEGHVVKLGPTTDIVNKYYELSSQSIVMRNLNGDYSLHKKKATIVKTELFDKLGEKRANFISGEKANFFVKAFFHEDVDNVVFGFFIRRPDGSLVNSTPSNELGFPPSDLKKGEEIVVKVEFSVNLLKGNYHIGTQITNADFTEFYDLIERAIVIAVNDKFSHGGIAHINPSYEIVKIK